MYGKPTTRMISMVVVSSLWLTWCVTYKKVFLQRIPVARTLFTRFNMLCVEHLAALAGLITCAKTLNWFRMKCDGYTVFAAINSNIAHSLGICSALLFAVRIKAVRHRIIVAFLSI